MEKVDQVVLLRGKAGVITHSLLLACIDDEEARAEAAGQAGDRHDADDSRSAGDTDSRDDATSIVTMSNAAWAKSHSHAWKGSGDDIVDRLARARRVSVSYKHILVLENLQLLRNVTHLQLDNNRITKIEGLESLVTLKWLDLSFNAIESMEGLRTLTELQDLSLTSNRIRNIHGIDSLTKLECLSLGGNQIDDLKQVLKLRLLPSLHAVALEGNPLATEDRDKYKTFCLYFLPVIRYLDYALVTAPDLIAARESACNMEIVVDAENAVAVMDRTRAAEASSAATASEARRLNVDSVDGVLADMAEEDLDVARFARMPGWTDLRTACTTSVQLSADTFREKLLYNVDAVEAEHKDFQAAVAEAVTNATHAMEGVVRQWENACLRVATHLRTAAWADTTVVGAASPAEEGALLTEQLAHACEQLTQGELRLHVQLMNMSDVYDSTLRELREAKQGIIDSFFRSAESNCHALTHGQHTLIESLAVLRAKSQPDDEIISLAADAETGMAAVTALHDSRLRRILERERETKAREDAALKSALAGAEEQEHTRNRQRMNDIQAWRKQGLDRVRRMVKEAESHHEPQTYTRMARAPSVASTM